MREKEGTLWKSGNACAMIRNRRSRNRTDENLGGMRMKKTLSLLLSLVLMLSLALPAAAAETEYPTLEGGVTEIQK